MHHDESPHDYEALRASLPAALQALVAGCTWHENRIGWSSMRVFRLVSASGDVSYLKVTTGTGRYLDREHDRLHWLHGRLPVPEVRFFAEDAERQLLLMTEVPGVPSFDPQFEHGDPARVIALLADGLRRIHSVDISTCPFDATINALLKRAIANIAAGRVDASGFDELHQGRSAEDLLSEALATRPRSEDLVFAHGDYCMPNVLVVPDSVTLGGFIDWGGAGVADRYLDLALAARSITYNWGAQWVAPFFDAYGTPPDEGKIAFFKLLDELAWVP